MTHTEVVNNMYQLFAEGKTESIRSIFSENIKWNMMPGFPNGDTYHGSEAVFEHVFGYFKKHWIEWKAVSEEFHETDKGVFVTGYYEGTFRNTGKYVKAKFATFYKVANNQVIEYHQWTDSALIKQATLT